MNPALAIGVAGVPLAAGFLAIRSFDPLRENVPPILPIYLVLYAVYLAAVFWTIRRVSADCRRKALVAGLMWAALFRMILFFSPPSLSDDIHRYLWDGRVQQAGINPYRYAPIDQKLNFLRDESYALMNHRMYRTVYPPLAQGVFRFGAWASPTVWTQKLLFVLFDFLLIAVLLGLLAQRKRSPLWVLVYAWNPLVVIEFSGSGHNDSLMLAFLFIGFWLYETGRSRTAAVGWGAAALSKFIPLVMVPWLFLRRRWMLPVLFGLTLAAGVLPYMSGFNSMVTAPFSSSGVGAYVKDWVFNPSLYAAVKAILGGATAGKIFLGVLLIGFAFWWAGINRLDPVRYAFGCFFGLLLASPVVHPWYVTWVIPFACFFPTKSGLAWPGLVFLSYHVLIRYVSSGIWHLASWVIIVEYGVLYTLMIWDLKSVWERRFRPEVGTRPSESGVAREAV